MLTGYTIDEATGAIQQERNLAPPVLYDRAYVERYKTLPIHKLSLVRWRWITATLETYRIKQPSIPERQRVLDYGCGLGAFLEIFADEGGEAFGFDIVHDYPLPYGVTRVQAPFAEAYDLVTFFDCLEHLEDPLFVLTAIQTRVLVISVPWCHARTLGDDWFQTWKHRKPGEHLWHFDAASLPRLAAQAGFKLLASGNPEDVIRRSDELLPNILTNIYVRP